MAKSRKVEKVPGAEAFFAGAKPDNVYIERETRDPPRSPPAQRRSREEDDHVYQNTGVVHAVTVNADVHRERTYPPRGRRRPMSQPRRSQAPSADLTPISENEGGERIAAYENAVFVSQQLR